MFKAIIFDLNGVLIFSSANGKRVDQELLDAIAEFRRNNKKAKCFTLSNYPADAAQRYRQDFPFLREYFDQNYFSGETGFWKPDPESFRVILEEHKLKPFECLYIDDQPGNVEACEVMGMQGVVYEGIGSLRKFLE